MACNWASVRDPKAAIPPELALMAPFICAKVLLSFVEVAKVPWQREQLAA